MTSELARAAHPPRPSVRIVDNPVRKRRPGAGPSRKPRGRVGTQLPGPPRALPPAEVPGVQFLGRLGEGLDRGFRVEQSECVRRAGGILKAQAEVLTAQCQAQFTCADARSVAVPAGITWLAGDRGGVDDRAAEFGGLRA